MFRSTAPLKHVKVCSVRHGPEIMPREGTAHWREWVIGAPATVEAGTWSNGSLVVIHRAGEIAAQQRSEQIDSSHLLVGLTQVNSFANRLLQAQGVSVQSLQEGATANNGTLNQEIEGAQRKTARNVGDRRQGSAIHRGRRQFQQVAGQQPAVIRADDDEHAGERVPRYRHRHGK